ncbi:MAG: acyltransferase family protein [Cetobacterium sp.]|uniref:acyltransferase n=1 Tax=Cetobacterium sp. TaxID=2071632 RepID=UPI002FC8AC3C
MKRENNLDCLRIIAVVMVIVIHLSAGYIVDNMDTPNFNFTVANFFDSISRTCVSIFVLLSGGFLLENNNNKSYKEFYNKSFKKVGIPTLIWSLVYVLYSYIRGILIMKITGISFDFFKPLFDWFLGVPFYHLWYLYMLFGLYAVTPILIRLKNDIGDRSFMKVGITLLILGIIVSKFSNLYWLVQFTKYLGYFILGYSLKIYKNKSPLFYFLIFIISSITIFILTEIIIRGNIWNKTLYFYQDLSPFVIISALSLYISFINMNIIKYDFSSLAKYSFNIYLIHAFFLEMIEFSVKYILKVEYNALIFILSMTPIIFVLSYGGSCFLEKHKVLFYQKPINKGGIKK